MSIHRRPAWQRLQQLLVPIGHSHCVQPIRLMAHAGMSILSLFEAYAPSHPGASEAELQAVEAHHGRFLPAALRELLRWSNGFRADMNRTFIDLWSTRVLVEWKDASGLPRRLPGLLVVGTDEPTPTTRWTIAITRGSLRWRRCRPSSTSGMRFARLPLHSRTAWAASLTRAGPETNHLARAQEPWFRRQAIQRPQSRSCLPPEAPCATPDAANGPLPYRIPEMVRH